MATAVKNMPETTSAPDSRAHLLRASLIGAVYVAACLGIVFFGIPYLWKLAVSPWVSAHLGPFFDPAGMAVVLLVAAIGLLIGGLSLAGPHPPHGLRAGVFTFVAGGVLLFLITVAIGQILQSYVIKDRTAMMGLGLTVAIGVGLLVVAVRYAMGASFQRFLVTFEGHGWFGTKSYKVNQGQRVRRLTMLGLLLVVGSGVYTMIDHKTLFGNWVVHLPFTDGRIATLLPDIRYTVPLLLIALGLWLAWRAVNFPIFADFLIATEAEMNKVSWTNRKRLVQDTIVVLVTLVLFTIFLLVVDQLWGWLLTRETFFGGIVPKPVPKVVKENAQDTQW